MAATDIAKVGSAAETWARKKHIPDQQRANSHSRTLTHALCRDRGGEEEKEKEEETC
jgi:hypothetical protein